MVYMRFLLFILLILWVNCAWGQESNPTEYPYGCEEDPERKKSWMNKNPLKCKKASFSYASFDSLADFSEASFVSEASFSYASFDSLADFSEASFNSETSFGKASFDSEAHFLGATFDNEAHFRGASFDNKASFFFATFDSEANFREIKFEENVDFEGTIYPDTLDFRSVETAHEIDLTYGRLNPAKALDLGYRSLIALEGTDISKIKLNMELFQLWFPDLKPDSNRGDAERMIDIYEDVLNKFETDGLKRSYRVLDIEYQSFVNQLEGRHFAHFFNKYWWNYGYNREWVVWWSLGWLGLFTIVNALLFKHLMNSVYTISQLELGETVFSLNFLKHPKWSPEANQMG